MHLVVSDWWKMLSNWINFCYLVTFKGKIEHNVTIISEIFPSEEKLHNTTQRINDLEIFNKWFFLTHFLHLWTVITHTMLYRIIRVTCYTRSAGIFHSRGFPWTCFNLNPVFHCKHPLITGVPPFPSRNICTDLLLTVSLFFILIKSVKRGLPLLIRSCLGVNLPRLRQ